MLIFCYTESNNMLFKTILCFKTPKAVVFIKSFRALSFSPLRIMAGSDFSTYFILIEDIVDVITNNYF